MRNITAIIYTVDHLISLLTGRWERYIRCKLLCNVYCVVLYCIVLYCIVLCCNLLCCIALYFILLYCRVLYYAVSHIISQYNWIQYCLIYTVQYSAVQYGHVQNDSLFILYQLSCSISQYLFSPHFHHFSCRIIIIVHMLFCIFDCFPHSYLQFPLLITDKILCYWNSRTLIL